MKVCTIDGCLRKHYGRGYCNAHWQQVFKLGKAPSPIRSWGPGQPGEPKGCAYLGCENSHSGHGWCAGHLAQIKRGEDPHDFRPRYEGCVVSGCDRPHRRTGLCDRHATMQRRYGTPAQDLQEMVDSAMVCEACGGPFVGGPHPGPKIDHCHETGIVRGLLCDPCNVVLGFVQDDPGRLRALANYLEASKCRT